jgi:hypothetical protein
MNMTAVSYAVLIFDFRALGQTGVYGEMLFTLHLLVPTLLAFRRIIWVKLLT